MKIYIAGGTGFIGSHLSAFLAELGYKIMILTRRPPAELPGSSRIEFVSWNGMEAESLFPLFYGDYAVINLAGESIAAGLWTTEKKKRIIASRIGVTANLKEACLKSTSKPFCFIQASASGYYGSSPNVVKESSPKGIGFLAEVSEQWEKALLGGEKPDFRVVIIRTGVVLGREGGMLPGILKPFRFFLGGYPGSGKQHIPWIHIQDEVEAIRFLLENQSAQGMYNLTAPHPATQKMFCLTLGRVLSRPCWMRIPEFLLKRLPENMGEELFLADQRVVPEALLNAGFVFRYPELYQALRELVKQKPG